MSCKCHTTACFSVNFASVCGGFESFSNYFCFCLPDLVTVCSLAPFGRLFAFSMSYCFAFFFFLQVVVSLASHLCSFECV